MSALNFIKKDDLLSNIKMEFQFFDETYFNIVTEAFVRIYYTGKGCEDGIQTADEELPYSELINAIKEGAED